MTSFLRSPYPGALLAAALFVAACGGRATAPVAAPAAGEAVPPGAQLLTVKLEPAAARIDVVGTAASEKIISVNARLSAYVNEVFASAGDRVKAGQVLLRLDDRELREQLAAAESQLKQAESEYKRAQALFEKNATTDQALTAAESGFHTARAQVERVRVMLSYAEVTSPLDGIVTERHVNVGDLASPGLSLLAVYDPADMRLEASVPVRLIEKLALGQQVEVALDYPRRTLQGEVTEIVSEIDPLSRTRKVKVKLNGADDVLPGAFGRLWIEEEPRPTILLPAAAVQRVGQLDIVRVVKDGRALRRLVRTGPRFGDQVEILSGLQAGESVVMGSGNTP